MKGWCKISKSVKNKNIYRMKGKNHTISTATEKAFNKIPYTLMIKTLSKMGVEGTYLKMIKTI